MPNLRSAPRKSPVEPYACVILAVVYLASVVAPLNQFKIPALMIFQGLIIGAIPTATFTAAPEGMPKPELAGQSPGSR